MYKLRELERKDLEKVNRWRNDPELIELLGAPYRFINLEVDIKWYESYMGNRGNAVRCAIVQDDYDEILGLISLVSINYINQSAELHIMIGDKENQGKGIGTFAVNIMLNHAFNNMNLRRVELSVLESNERAKALYEKCGFVYEGTKRQAKYKKGKFENVSSYSILRDEFVFSGGGIAETYIPSFNIVEVKNRVVIDKIINECDSAFQNPLKTRKEYLELLDKLSEYAYVVCAYREKILGYIAFYANNPDKAYISLIAINPQYQNQSIGSHLITYCEDIVKSKKIPQIQLEVKKDNKSAILFYQKNGFQREKEKDEKSYYMKKELCSR